MEFGGNVDALLGGMWSEGSPRRPAGAPFPLRVGFPGREGVRRGRQQEEGTGSGGETAPKPGGCTTYTGRPHQSPYVQKYGVSPSPLIIPGVYDPGGSPVFRRRSGGEAERDQDQTPEENPHPERDRDQKGRRGRSQGEAFPEGLKRYTLRDTIVFCIILETFKSSIDIRGGGAYNTEYQ